ncbi:MAG: cell division protein FtsL [Clostridia bacterium]|nr:cell division protein FtsL [Clostridia bacterium]
MIADKAYAYDLSVPEITPDYMPSKKDFKIIKTPKKVLKQNTNNVKKTKAELKSKLSLILTVVALFVMALAISYRYNLISEKNLELQRLKMEQVTANSELATTEVAIDRIIDKDTVESYAKQQLGMQKPEKSQIIYINSNYETKVEEIDTNNIFEIGLEKLKNLIGM